MGIICSSVDEHFACGFDDGLDIERGVGSTWKVTSFVLIWGLRVTFRMGLVALERLGWSLHLDWNEKHWNGKSERRM